ncbi:hypothetical protein D9757_003654 [Collybiopsis confluens]|uniref:Uncharacterized protein n=1 Tax=Collybiopsis confluens TaxID=2823264 RepID=A0A8H5HV17_9AGAR|nr:hypothetical protein D9757_003654 [Collybiopsis confluens]
MSSPHSLTFPSNSSPQPGRNSLSQLPLPSGMTTPSPQPATPNSSIIPASAINLKARNPGSPTSMNFPATTHSHIPHTSSTHAGGVQPSSSFFRPSRPRYSPPPDSPSSSNMPSHEEREVFRLSDLGRNSDSTGENSEMAHAASFGLRALEQDSMKGLKQSRDPLLTVGETPTITGKDRSDIARSNRPQHSRKSSRLRTSLDMVFNIRRGASIDSATAAPPSGRFRHKPGHSASSEGFGSIGFHDKRKLHDEERGYSTTHFSSLRRHHSTNSSRNPSSLVSTRYPSRAPAIPAGYKPPHSEAVRTSSGNDRLFAEPMYAPRGQIIRRWQLHPSRNRFFFKGHVLTGGDSPWAFIVCFSVVCAITGLWFGTTCQWWWFHEGAGGKVMVCLGGYLSLIVISCMLKTAFTDPGILPRNLDPDPPYPATSPSEGGVRAPMPRDLRVRTDVATTASTGVIIIVNG